ncbi:hypothetical protein [Actinosynnema sp. NPDC020468]|uniref:hypothetical protein n=1 Tax=Actinosynnema sp. NPDC020468 TaxID=3154488 RepID=UPI0033C52C8D
MRTWKRAVGTLVAACAVLATTAVPAVAGQGTPQWVESASWAGTDLRTPFKTITTGEDVPVGAWQDAKGLHVSKAYYTIDLTSLRGTAVVSASGFARETAVTDCARPRSTELWLTEDATAPTYAHQPRELALIGGSRATPTCVWPTVEFDLKDTITKALAAGRTKITVALRMSGAKQWDPRYGRRFGTSFGVSVWADHAPDKPTALRLGLNGTECGGVTNNPTPDLMATVWDTDHDQLTATAVLDGTRQLTATASYDRVYVPVPAGVLGDGETHTWTIRTNDGRLDSPTSEPCTFGTDFTAPDRGPVVTSTDYVDAAPGTGGGAVPGTFAFEPNGVTDVVAYTYSTGSSTGRVEAGPDGRATASIRPGGEGRVQLIVWSHDRADNSSPPTTYTFQVASTKPALVVTRPSKWTVQVDVTGGSPVDPVVTWNYRLGSSLQTKPVPAGPGGAARFTLPVERNGALIIRVKGTTASGGTAPETTAIVNVPGTTSVTNDVYAAYHTSGGVGVPSTFTVDTNVVGTTRIAYQDGETGELTTVDAVDGVASFPYTPTTAGEHTVLVHLISATGESRLATNYTFTVG